MNVSGIILSGNMNEQIIYDDPQVECAVYSVAYDHYFRTQVPWHWHDEIEILRMVSGECLYSTSHEEVRLLTGDAVFLAPGTLHNLIPLESGTLSHALLFTQKFLAGDANSALQERYVLPLIARVGRDCIHIDRKDPIISIIQETECLGTDKPYLYEPRLLRCVWEIWESLLAKTANASDSISSVKENPLKLSREDERIRKMLLYIEKHYDENISVADLARSADVSERECYRLFSQEVHEPPAQFLLDYRIRRSQSLLLSGSMPITEIAEQCGFINSSHFARVFHSITGMTPSSFRKKYIWQE